MPRRLLLPVALLLLAAGAFAVSAAAFADGRDVGGLYWLAVALVAARAQQRITGALA